jgi:hypothetical protein
MPTMAEMLAEGNNQKFCFNGCADDRAKKITKAFVRILNRTNVSLL